MPTRTKEKNIVFFDLEINSNNEILDIGAVKHGGPYMKIH